MPVSCQLARKCRILGANDKIDGWFILMLMLIKGATFFRWFIYIYTVTPFKYVEGGPDREASEVVWNTSSYI